MSNNKGNNGATEKSELLLHLFFIILLGIMLVVLSSFSINLSKEKPTPSIQHAINYNQKLLKTLSIKTAYFSTDKLQQFYILTLDNELIKYNSNGQELFRYNENRFGTLAHIDATNPFQILLYYPDFLTIVTLDRTLNPIHIVNLSDLNIVQTQAVGLSTDNNVWVYDDVSFRLKKINQRKETLTMSNDLSLELGTTLQPNFLVERNNQIFLNNPSSGILVFDVFGQFSKILDLKDLDYFQILDHQLFYQQGNQLLVFNLKSLATQSFALPESVRSEDQFHVQKNRLYVVKPSKVEIYKI